MLSSEDVNVPLATILSYIHAFDTMIVWCARNAIMYAHTVHIVSIPISCRLNTTDDAAFGLSIKSNCQQGSSHMTSTSFRDNIRAWPG